MNKHSAHIDDDLLVKYLLGEASETEEQAVQEWVASGEEQAHYFHHFKLIWDQSKQLASTSQVQPNEAWDRFQQRIQDNATRPRVIQLQPSRPYRKWLSIAATVMVVVVAGWMVYHFTGRGTQGSEMMALRTQDNILTDTLSDGSIVTLNRQSAISYERTFKGDVREVKLEGEAFFSIAKDENKPFIIHANDVTVRVLGTSFNVKSGKEQTEVIVETGMVEVSKETHSVQLKVKEKATVYKDQAEPVKQENIDELYNYYRTKTFVCNETPLWKLVATLNEAYHANIVIGNSQINDLPLTTTFHNQSLDTVLMIIRQTLGEENVQIERKGQQIIIK